MLRVAVVILALVVLASLISSCCIGPCARRSRTVTIPTPGGSVSVSKSGGGKMEITTPEGKTVVSGDEGKMEITGPEGEKAVVTKEGTQVTNAKGERFVSGTRIPSDVADKLDLPMYPGAESVSYTDAGHNLTATLKTTDDYSKVESWYKDKLGSGWDTSVTSVGEMKMANFRKTDPECSVMLMLNSQDNTTMITLARTTGGQ